MSIFGSLNIYVSYQMSHKYPRYVISRTTSHAYKLQASLIEIQTKDIDEENWLKNACWKVNFHISEFQIDEN